MKNGTVITHHYSRFIVTLNDYMDDDTHNYVWRVEVACEVDE